MSRRSPQAFRLGVVTILLGGVLSLSEASTPVKEVIVVCSSQELDVIRTNYGAAIVDAIPVAGAYLISLPSQVNPAELKSVNNAIVTSQNFLLGMRDDFKAPGALGDLRWDSVSFHSSSVPRFYLEQLAANKIEALAAHRWSTGRRSIVALIDTGIDEAHPVLRNSIVHGRNYVASGTPSEWNDPLLDQSHAMVFDLLQIHASGFDLDQSHAQVFDLLKGNVRVLFGSSDYSSFSASSLPDAFGHGTMTAGIVHLVAPDALLMPMKAFDDSGHATVWNVIRAIRDSVEMGAHVINMSFSAPNDQETAQLLRTLAVDYAKASNIALVAAAGNWNQEVEVLPAAIEPVVAVGGVTSEDLKAPFSNYSYSLDFSAPGTDVITTYPGAFAMVSGTSFSVPFVSGLYALLKEIGIDGSSSRGEIEGGSEPIWQINDTSLKDKLGKGRINAFKTLSKKF